MGQLDQFAKQIFAEETETVTQGGAAWQSSPELNLSEVRLDGLLLVRAAAALRRLAPPWGEAQNDREIVVELKMPGDHLSMPAVQRALLRRQARQVQRGEDTALPWDGEEPLWVVAPHVPAILCERRVLQPVSPGCYRVGPGPFPFLWIAANELPLVEELIPFLIARSGRSLDAFGLWIKNRRPSGWLLRMLGFLRMSTTIHDEIMHFLLPKADDPEMREGQLRVGRTYIKAIPELYNEVLDEGRVEGRREGRLEGQLSEVRSNLRRVMVRRQIALSAEDQARIDACDDIPTLERWLDQAIVAATAAEALR